MQKRVVIQLNEGLERYAEPAAIVEQRVVVIGNSPRPRIEIEAGVEFASLSGAAEFGVNVAAPDRPIAAAGAEVVFEDLNLVAGAQEFERRRHSRQTRAQNNDRGALRISFQLDRTSIGRLDGKSQTRHGLVEGPPASGRADQCEQTASARRRAQLHRHWPLTLKIRTSPGYLRLGVVIARRAGVIDRRHSVAAAGTIFGKICSPCARKASRR